MDGGRARCVVHLTRTEPRYGAALEGVEAPELAPDVPRTTALGGLRKLLFSAGLDRARYGQPDWSPMSVLVQPGERVLLKPNWVHHRNASGEGEDALVTHGDVVRSVLEYLARARPGSVTVGDAPVQGCDFDALARLVGAEGMVNRFSSRLPEFRLVDFRRKILASDQVGASAHGTDRTDDDYVLFDLGRDSMLEPISSDADRFRVTMYDPRALRATHAQGRHQYLVAREVIDADVVFNLPKLKTHKKAGITAALKNAVGVNGHKEYLPHHRLGGVDRGGDNYCGGSRAKWLAELALDRMNASGTRWTRAAFGQLARGLIGLGVLLGADSNVDGSWAGNDTVWRMTLDLDRILIYGRADGTLSPTPMRRVVTITDGIVAGQGEGPLAPSPLPLGVMTFATNLAAAEVVHARLLGLDPARVPLVRHAFDAHPNPVADCSLAEVELCVDGRAASVDSLPLPARRARVPKGWRGACELAEERT